MLWPPHRAPTAKASQLPLGGRQRDKHSARRKCGLGSPDCEGNEHSNAQHYDRETPTDSPDNVQSNRCRTRKSTFRCELWTAMGRQRAERGIALHTAHTHGPLWHDCQFSVDTPPRLQPLHVGMPLHEGESVVNGDEVPSTIDTSCDTSTRMGFQGTHHSVYKAHRYMCKRTPDRAHDYAESATTLVVLR